MSSFLGDAKAIGGAGGGGGSSPVTSVFGRIGNVVAQDGDYLADQINFSPTSNLQSTNSQDAIEEVLEYSKRYSFFMMS